MKQHRIPDPPPITGRMTSGALGTAAHDLIGRTIVTAYEVPDSDRDEVLLLTSDGRVFELSCDPGYNDDLIGRNQERWEFCMYDATETPAGEAIKTLEPGHWL